MASWRVGRRPARRKSATRNLSLLRQILHDSKNLGVPTVEADSWHWHREGDIRAKGSRADDRERTAEAGAWLRPVLRPE